MQYKWHFKLTNGKVSVYVQLVCQFFQAMFLNTDLIYDYNCLKISMTVKVRLYDTQFSQGLLFWGHLSFNLKKVLLMCILYWIVHNLRMCIYIYIYVCVCVRVRVSIERVHFCARFYIYTHFHNICIHTYMCILYIIKVHIIHKLDRQSNISCIIIEVF